MHIAGIICASKATDRKNWSNATRKALFVAGVVVARVPTPQGPVWSRRTTHLISHGLLALLHNPDQPRKLRDDPTLIAAAIILCLGAANRDPEQFPDPDRLDIGRRENRPIAFGTGVHFCLGAPLARIEAQITFATLLRRLPGLRLETEVLEWEPSLSYRGLARLPVAFAT